VRGRRDGIGVLVRNVARDETQHLFSDFDFHRHGRKAPSHRTNWVSSGPLRPNDVRWRVNVGPERAR
jgi:hypothetical protein